MAMGFRKDTEEFVRQLKVALFANSPNRESASRLFPEMFPEPEKIEFRPTSPEEVVQAIASLGRSGQVSVEDEEGGWI